MKKVCVYCLAVVIMAITAFAATKNWTADGVAMQPQIEIRWREVGGNTMVEFQQSYTFTASSGIAPSKEGGTVAVEANFTTLPADVKTGLTKIKAYLEAQAKTQEGL